jgi:hypothetical protein
MIVCTHVRVRQDPTGDRCLDCQAIVCRHLFKERLAATVVVCLDCGRGWTTDDGA